MKKPIVKLTSAAVITIFVACAFLLSSLTSNNRVWAGMLNNMKEMNWIYFDIVFNTSPEVTEEMTKSHIDGLPLWVSFNPEVHITKKINGEIIYTDRDQEIRYHYFPDSNMVTIDSHASTLSNPKSPFEIIEHYIELFQDNNVSIQSEFIFQDGREVEIIRVSHNETNIIGVRDVVRNLLVKISIETHFPAGSAFIAKTDIYLSYPETGPADIFDTGAPANVQLVDKRKADDTNEIFQTIQQYFDYNYGNRICLLLHSRSMAGSEIGPYRMVVSRKQQNVYRADTYYAEKREYIFPDQPTVTIYEQIKDIWPYMSIEEALSIENSNCVVSQDFYDGKYAILLQGGPPAESLRTRLNYSANGPTFALNQDINSWAWINTYDLGVNNSRIEEAITRLDENPQYQGLIGFNISHRLEQKGPDQKQHKFEIIYELWIDPEKDFMIIHRTKWQHEYVADRIAQTFLSEAHILETSQTSDGQWYPVHVESKMHYSDNLESNDEINDIVIRIDTDWTSSEEIFQKNYIINAQ